MWPHNVIPYKRWYLRTKMRKHHMIDSPYNHMVKVRAKCQQTYEKRDNSVFVIHDVQFVRIFCVLLISCTHDAHINYYFNKILSSAELLFVIVNYKKLFQKITKIKIRPHSYQNLPPLFVTKPTRNHIHERWKYCIKDSPVCLDKVYLQPRNKTVI